MRNVSSRIWVFVAVIGLGVTCWALVASSQANPTVLGGPPSSCCNPDDEPGVGGNPICFEGHTCCADGQWRCNNADGSPSCPPGEVCPEGCADKNEPCDADEDCCSGDCKNNGRCR